MSRSYRKRPFSGITTAETEKDDKRRANRKLRRKVKRGDLDLTIRDVSNIWSFDKDGKSRFDPDKYPELKRK